MHIIKHDSFPLPLPPFPLGKYNQIIKKPQYHIMSGGSEIEVATGSIM